MCVYIYIKIAENDCTFTEHVKLLLNFANIVFCYKMLKYNYFFSITNLKIYKYYMLFICITFFVDRDYCFTIYI